MTTKSIRTEQRFIDEERTQPLAGSFNVFVGDAFVGTVYAVGDEWQYGTMREERCGDFDEAVKRHVALNERLTTAKAGEIVRG